MRKPLILAFLVILLFSSVCVVYGEYWPGPEGLDCGVHGYQVTRPPTSIGYYQTNELFPSTGSPRYSWVQWPTVEYANCLIGKWEDFGLGQLLQINLLAERQTPVRDELSGRRLVQYWIQEPGVNGSTVWHKISGYVVPWVFTIQLSLHPTTIGSAGIQSRMAYDQGEAVWFGLGTKAWNRAFQDPENTSAYSNAGWSIPLSCYIEKYSKYGEFWTEKDGQRQKKPATEWVDQCVQITPDYDGRTVQLFTNPETPTVLTDIWYHGDLDTSGVSSALDTVNASVVSIPNPLAPDSRFANNAYFKFTFTKFKVKDELDWLGQLVAVWYPSVYFRLRVYYLELGEFTYVQKGEDLPEWDARGWLRIFAPYGDWAEAFFNALGMLNPFSVFGPYAGLVAFLFILAIVIVVVLALVAVFAPWAFRRLTKATGQVISTAKEATQGRGKKHGE